MIVRGLGSLIEREGREGLWKVASSGSMPDGERKALAGCTGESDHAFT